MFRIGVTGGIGSGKSTVAALLAQQGVALVDADAIARELTATGGIAIPALRNVFGVQAIACDGSMDRAYIRGLVFADPAAKGKLEGMLHPLIEAEAARRESAITGPAIVFDVPLLAESSQWLARMDRVLVVDCRESTQVERVIQRSDWSEDAVRAVIAQQLTRAARRRCADAVIYNDGITLAQLAQQVDTLRRLWLPG